MVIRIVLRCIHPFSHEFIMPLLKQSVEHIGLKPQITKNCRIVVAAFTKRESDQSYAILDIELQHIAAIIECFITIWCPCKIV